jgi:hypothetical protein
MSEPHSKATINGAIRKGQSLPKATAQSVPLREGVPMPARPAGSASPVAPLPPGSAVPPKNR